MDGKTLAERLREESRRGCTGQIISATLTGEYAMCPDPDASGSICGPCHREWFGKLADAIEAERGASA